MVSIDFTTKWEMSDVVLKTSDSEELLHANRAVLAINSPFFKALLYGDYAESKQDVVNLDGIDFWVMAEILKIIHNVDRRFDGTKYLYSVAELTRLWQIADGYDIPLIRELCRQQIPKLKPAEALETAILCGLHEQKSEILKQMKFEDIQKYLKKGVTELVLSPADATVIVEKCMEVEKAKHSSCPNCTVRNPGVMAGGIGLSYTEAVNRFPRRT